VGLLTRRHLAPGEHAYVDGAGNLRQYFCVRVRTGPDLSPDDREEGPIFRTDGKAQEYADMLNGVGRFEYGMGAV
jgi:hypothetical protein